MSSIELRHRLAGLDDLETLRELINAAISELQRPYLDDQQIASSRTIMGLDTRLIEDGTYFVVESNGALAGYGGWSRRVTPYGGDQSPRPKRRSARPHSDPARVRTMYTHPGHVRKQVGRLILGLCEAAARSEGFTHVWLMATMAGEPLYRACGYKVLESTQDDRGGTAVPLLRMRKAL